MTEEKSEEEHIKNQINQLREAIIALENQSEGVPCIEPEELWHVMQQNMGDTESIHPKIRSIMVGHVNVDEVKKALKRLENDLHDLQHIGDKSERLYDPLKNDVQEEEEEDKWNRSDDEDSEDATDEDSPAMMREREQRPLTAYINSNKD
jgi:hypothetical protein